MPTIHRLPEVRASRCRLVVESGEHEGMIHPLSEPIVTIGRGPDNLIQIIDPRMSRNHLLLTVKEDGWHLRDNGSKNGTWIDERPVQGDVLLRPGSRVRVGDTLLLFEQEQPATTTTETSGTGMRLSDDDEPIVPRHVVRLPTDSTPLPQPSLVRHDDAQRLALFYKVTDATSDLQDLDELLERVVDLIQEGLTPDRVGILLYDPAHNLLLPKVIRRPSNATDDIIISNSIITQAVNDKVALLVGDAAQDSRFNAAESIATQRIRSAICAPLCFKDVLQGVLYLDRRGSSGGYSEDDLRLAAGIANQTSGAVANARLHRQLMEQHARERELAIARSIQEHLQPREMPILEGFEIHGFSRPALMVGGDYFDVIPLPDGRVVLAVADVSGKGVPAAILLAEVRTAVQLEMRAMGEATLPQIMERLNQLICRDSADNMFVTLVLGLLDPQARRLAYCNAGHVYSLLRKPNGRIETLETGGCLLGVIPGASFEEGEVELAPGSALLMYSDGVTDTMNAAHECYGVQRLSDLLGVLGSQPAETICRRIDQSALEFSSGAEPFDDFTLLAIRSLK